MKRKSFKNTQCSIARTLEIVGEWWNMMILRDALHGIARFEHFQKSLDIAPNMLARRLNGLVKAGLLAKRRYCAHPPRYEYVLTPRGRDFRPVIIAIGAWGNRHLAPEGASVVLVEKSSGTVVEPVVVDRASGRPVDSPDFVYAPGPAASERTKLRMKFAAGVLSAEDYIQKLEALLNISKRRKHEELPT
jgi:DNA-binding HxlR family transcriptional regulator